MKVTKLREELKKASDVQLLESLEGLRRQLFAMRINAATSHTKDNSQFLKLRRSIARVLTEMNARMLFASTEQVSIGAGKIAGASGSTRGS